MAINLTRRQWRSQINIDKIREAIVAPDSPNKSLSQQKTEASCMFFLFPKC